MKHWNAFDWAWRSVLIVIGVLVFMTIMSGSAIAQETKHFRFDFETQELKEVKVIESDSGGVIEKYVDLVQEYIDNDIYVEVVGNCWSACTLLSKLVETDQICVHPSASFHFHAPHRREMSTGKFIELAPPAYQTWFLQQYPNKLQMLIASNGGLTINWMHVIGSDLKYIAPYCK